MEYILIFLNTHRALECEKVLEKNFINFTILPAPSHITNSCGICIAISSNDIKKIYNLIKNGEVVIKDIYDNINNELINISKIDFN